MRVISGVTRSISQFKDIAHNFWSCFFILKISLAKVSRFLSQIAAELSFSHSSTKQDAKSL